MPQYSETATRKAGTLLILGGTGFIGPSLTNEALRRGWRVTHFNRGKHEELSIPGLETLFGDRNGQLESLRGRKWDAVIDNTGYVPKYVKASSELLASATDYMLFISSTAAYASFAQPNDESSPLHAFPDPDIEIINDVSYGPMKVLCEHYVERSFAHRFAIVRPGYIVGPGDTAGNFTYWPVRYSRGGEMIAPGTPDDPVQIIDVRDLTALMMNLVEKRTQGIFNAISEPRRYTMGKLLHCCRQAASGAATNVTWVPEDFLRQAWRVDEVKLIPWAQRSGSTAALALVSTDRAHRAGLKTRPLEETTRDTLAWFQSQPAEHQAKMRLLVDPEKEARTLAAWHQSAAHA